MVKHLEPATRFGCMPSLNSDRLLTVKESSAFDANITNQVEVRMVSSR